jgi:hypothetical protein
MAEEGVIGATIEETKRHPYLIVGGLVAVVVVLWIVSSGTGSKTAAQPFTFSYGPSDTQVKAGTALAIAQAGDQTAVTLAGMQSTQNTAIAQDYFGYLSTNSANQLAATVNTNGTAVQVSALNNASDQIASNNALTATVSGQYYANATAMNGNATQAQIAGIQAGTAQTQILSTERLGADTNATQLAMAGYAMQTTLGVQNIQANVASQQILSNERLGADNNATKYAIDSQAIASNYYNTQLSFQ